MKYILLFILLSFGAWAQNGDKKQYTTFKGIVIDSLDRKPIESAPSKLITKAYIPKQMGAILLWCLMANTR
jgi:hypothetical protein